MATLTLEKQKKRVNNDADIDAKVRVGHMEWFPLRL